MMNRSTRLVLEHMSSGKPISPLSALALFGIRPRDLERVIWNVRIRGYHVSTSHVVGLEKHNGKPASFTEYRLKEHA